MKIALAIALIAICSFAFAATEGITPENLTRSSAEDAQSQWGIAALNFPKHVHLNSAEALGLNLPEVGSSSVINQQFSGLNASYSYGKFSATTGLLSQSNSITESSRFYLQGAYNIFENERFNLALTAKVEALDEDSVNHYYGQNENFQQNTSIFEQLNTNTTIELVSTYSITKQWKVHGVISSTTLDNKIEDSPLINDDNIHMALIKTSYAF